jgi:hypothetical protein
MLSKVQRLGLDWLSSVMGRACEKAGWPNCIILFCLVNIPTVGSKSSQERVAMDVQKWDKQVAG